MINKLNDVWDKVSKEFSLSGPKYWNWFGGYLVDLSEIKLGNTVLDIGFGRGASLFPAIKKVGIGGKVFGIEASYGMVYFTKKNW